MLAQHDANLRIDGLVERRGRDAPSLVVTIFGDAILPHGGAIWLQSLAKLAAAFGVNERAVRTSVFRLAKDGWLVSTQVGRRSSYRLTDAGRRRFEAADRAIYAAGPRRWSGRWTLVIAGSLGLRNDLVWQGFGRLAADVFVHPEPDEAALREAIGATGDGAPPIVMQATSEGWMRSEDLPAIVSRAWSLDHLAAVYDQFLRDFRPFEDADTLAPGAAFRLRILLIHAWRRAVLRDPRLPDEWLPEDWPGTSARSLCRELYLRVGPAAEAFLAATMATADGPVGAADIRYFERFGGLGAG